MYNIHDLSRDEGKSEDTTAGKKETTLIGPIDPSSSRADDVAPVAAPSVAEGSTNDAQETVKEEMQQEGVLTFYKLCHVQM